MNYIKKIDNIVKSISKNTKGGNTFFDQIDASIKNPKNIDLTMDLFDKIYNDFGFNYNLIVSGGFGDVIMWLIKKDKIICHGSIIQASGELTSHFTDMNKIKKGKEIKIEKSIGDIENKDFIFVDDSYYSGSTEKSINNYLKSFKSKIIKTYVIYDGNDKKNSNRLSTYNYYDWNKGSNRTIDELTDELHKYNGIPTDVFLKKIIKGEITSIIELRKKINQFRLKTGNQGIDVYTRVREGLRYLKYFESFSKK